jgi:hypothetical protein
MWEVWMQNRLQEQERLCAATAQLAAPVAAVVAHSNAARDQIESQFVSPPEERVSAPRVVIATIRTAESPDNCASEHPAIGETKQSTKCPAFRNAHLCADHAAYRCAISTTLFRTQSDTVKSTVCASNCSTERTAFHLSYKLVVGDSNIATLQIAFWTADASAKHPARWHAVHAAVKTAQFGTNHGANLSTICTAIRWANNCSFVGTK